MARRYYSPRKTITEKARTATVIAEDLTEAERRQQNRQRTDILNERSRHTNIRRIG